MAGGWVGNGVGGGCSAPSARRAETRGEDVLNGIAYDATADRLWVTGKLWPRVFRVALTRKRPGRRA